MIANSNKYIKCLLSTIILLAVASSATCKEFFKYIDQNGIEYWLDDKSKIPPPMPIKHKYVDSIGVTFWVDDESKIPPQYRNQNLKEGVAEKSRLKQESIASTPLEKKQYSTKISIINNQIIVPVVFRNKGRKVKARMILDTGATVTTIYQALASKLNLSQNKMSRGRSIIANGTIAESLLTKIDYIEVDDKILSNSEVMVMMENGNIGADGLLGNSFLRYFKFTIDYDKQLLIWDLL